MRSILLRSVIIAGLSSKKKTDVLVAANKTIETIGSVKDHRDADIVEGDGMLLLPLLIDCHVHFREPGLEYKATMETESASALAGGVGTVCEMPNTIPPTVTVAALADKIRRSEKIEGMNLHFFFGITEAAHLLTLKELWTGEAYELKRLRNKCCGVKLYLDHSTGDQKVQSEILDDVFQACADLKIPLVAHCEHPEMNAAAKAKYADSTHIEDHSIMRPPESEAAMIKHAIAVAESHGTALHIAHLSTAQGVDLVRAAKKKKLKITCEVAPHHLFLTTDDYASLGAQAKMNPPLRSADHRDALWQGIADGTVDCIATDHAPHTLDEKSVAEPLSAPSGVPGVETMLPLLLTVAAGKWPHPTSSCAVANMSHEDIVRLCFTNPNKIFSLHQEEIVKGTVARLMLVDPKAEWTIEGKNLKSKCGWTPFEGWRVCGKITNVIQ